ncbi:MAG: hypothetical protein R3B70_43270 [Polyangiaceae bacterium]
MTSLASSDLIQLPRLTTAEAAGLLGDMLHAASIVGPLPAGIDRSRQRLAGAYAALESAITGIPVGAEDAERQREADRAIDNAWEATFLWLSAFCRLPDAASAHIPAARTLFAQIFPDGTAFTRLPYKVQFAESQARLDAIANEGHEETFAVLGGSAFLAELYRTHKAYEAALKPLLELDDDPRNRHEELAAAMSALRQYVSRVVSFSDPDLAGSEALSNALLAPLSRWYRLHPSRGPDMSPAGDDDTTPQSTLY